MLSQRLNIRNVISYGKYVRTFATEDQLKKRMKSIANIKKITSAMKMVASARLRRSQQKLEAARAFTSAITDAYPEVEQEKIDEVLTSLKDNDGQERNTKAVVAAIACDRGLCGAMNSSIVRDVKKKFVDGYKAIQTANTTTDIELTTFGSKALSGIERLYGKYINFAITDSGKSVELNFKQTARLTDHLLSLNPDRLQIIANWFKNMISFNTNTTDYYPPTIVMQANSSALEDYEIEGPDGEELDNFYSFRMACIMWGHFAEADACELSARVSAMENSAKNAGEMLDKITLQYNQMRQSKITTELIEIISGSAALEDQ